MARDIGFTITVKGTEQQLKKIGLLDQSLKRLATQRAELLKKVKDGIMLSKEEQVALGKLTVESKKLQAQKSKTLAQIKTENELVKSTAGSYNRLVLENKKLTDAARRLSDPLGKNKKRFQELSSQINTNTGRLKKMDAAMDRSFRNVGNYSGAIGRLRGGFVAMGAAIAAGIIAFRAFARFAGATLDIVIDFDQAVADLGSILGKTSDEMKILTEDAQRLGSSTKFTATEVAKLQKEFAKLGFSEKEILNATEATLSLASATNTELNEAAKVVGATVRGFNLDAAETQRVVDVMAKSFSSSALDMSKFEVAMSKVAPVAKAVGLDIEETTGIMGSLADAGIEASTVGTSLRKIFIELADKGLTLDEALERITSSQDRLSEATKLFGVRAATSALVMAENSEKARELTEELRNAGGTAQTMAETQLDTLRGSTTILTSAWEGFILGLESGRGVLGRTIRSLIDLSTSILNALTPSQSLTSEFRNLEKETEKNTKQVNALLEEYDELISITEKTVKEQQRLDDVMAQLVAIVPEAASEFDEYGNVLSLNTELIKENLAAQQALTDNVKDDAIAAVQGLIDKQKEFIKFRRDSLDRDEEFFKSQDTFAEKQADTEEAIRKANLEIAQQAIELTDLGVALSEENLLIIINTKAVSLQALSTNDLIRARREASVDLRKQLSAEIKGRFEVAEAKKKIAKDDDDLDTGQTKAEREALAKQIAKNNATILALNRELIEETIKLNSEGNAQQQSLLEESHRQEIEDLEAQKGEVAAINEAIDDLIEAKEKSHQAEITAIQQEGVDEQNNNRMAALDLEQQQALTAVAESEDTEKEKQQAILDIQIEFAEKRLRLLEETGDLTDAQVRLQIESLKQLLAELETEGEDDELSGFAKLLNITDEEAEFIRARAMEVAQQISDAIFTIQQRNDKRRTDARLKAVDEESKAELSILQDKLDNGIISQEEFDNQRVQLEDKADRKTEAIERKAFNRNKVLSLVQVGVDTASAIVKAIAQFGPPPSPAGIAAIASALLIGGTQALVIGSQKFKEGGELVGPSHEQGGIKSGGVEFEGGEGVINKRSMRSGDVLSVSGTPRDIASQINSYKGFGVPFGGTRRKFQLGGVAPAPNIAPQGAGSIAAISTGVSLEDVAELIIEAQNAQVIQVVETDITDTQNDVSVIEALQA